MQAADNGTRLEHRFAIALDGGISAGVEMTQLEQVHKGLRQIQDSASQLLQVLNIEQRKLELVRRKRRRCLAVQVASNTDAQLFRSRRTRNSKLSMLTLFAAPVKQGRMNKQLIKTPSRFGGNAISVTKFTKTIMPTKSTAGTITMTTTATSPAPGANAS